MNESFFKSRPTKSVVNLSNLEHNLSVVRSIVGDSKVMGVVKADAYGHGLVEIAKRLEEKDIDYLGVAYFEEGKLLRENNVCKPILVLGAVIKDQVKEYIKYDIEFTGSSIEKLREIDRVSKELKTKAKVHIKIDTGMGRIGVQWDRVDTFISDLLSFKNISIVGIYTHLSSSDSSRKYTKLQYKRFEIALKKFKKYLDIDSLLIHYANSSMVANNKGMDLKDMVRVGLLLYGYSDNPLIQKKLSPVMSLHSVVSYFKVLEKGCPISYNMKYITKRQTRVVTIPIGYADGYSIEFSNRGIVMINGNKYPIRGKICMDQCMVEVGKGECYVGDKVELFGDNILLKDLCKNTNETPYTLLTGISQRVPRVYIE